MSHGHFPPRLESLGFKPKITSVAPPVGGLLLLVFLPTPEHRGMGFQQAARRFLRSGQTQETQSGTLNGLQLMPPMMSNNGRIQF